MHRSSEENEEKTLHNVMDNKNDVNIIFNCNDFHGKGVADILLLSIHKRGKVRKNAKWRLVGDIELPSDVIFGRIVHPVGRSVHCMVILAQTLIRNVVAMTATTGSCDVVS